MFLPQMKDIGEIQMKSFYRITELCSSKHPGQEPQEWLRECPLERQLKRRDTGIQVWLGPELREMAKKDDDTWL